MQLFNGYILMQERIPALPVQGSRKPNIYFEFRPSGFDSLRIIQGQQESEIAR